MRESPLLSKPITFSKELAGVWKANFQSLTNGHSYYYQVGDSPIAVNVKFKELDKAWAHSYELTTNSIIQAVAGQYVTVIEVIPVSVVSIQIIASQSFKLTSTTPNTPTD
ncbi:hypothetical protein D3C86_1881850 [compost metagenome]